MSNKPLLSVVIPIFNTEKYINRCINSIILQKFENYEILLVDDGSNDQSPQLCDKWCLKEDRIRVIHKDNHGLGEARNTGIDNALGEYICFFDSDDYIKPGLFQKFSKSISNRKVDLTMFGLEQVDQKGVVLKTFIPNLKNNYFIGHEVQEEFLPELIAPNPFTGKASNLMTSVCCGIFNLEVLKINNFRFKSERTIISEDTFFYLEILSHIYNVQILNERYYCYVSNANSLSTTYREDRFKKIVHFYQSADKLCIDKSYNKLTRLQIIAPFINYTVACLKMEILRTKNLNWKKKYYKVKEICQNQYLVNAMKIYPIKSFPVKLHIFCRCIKYRLIILVMIFVYLRGN